MKMMFRFSLYGFLKNQRYFEPFLWLAFLEKGLSFSEIGFLIGFRELTINILEIPTGAIADVFGRRRSMVYSMLSYIVSFLIFAFANELWQFFAAMLLYAAGDAFRTGTHKAIILDWLRSEGREDERTKTYGYTRSWSLIGSTVMAPIAAGLALLTGTYSHIFLFSLIPYVLNIVNLATYPAYLDGERNNKRSLKDVVAHLWASARHIFRGKILRRKLIESMTYQGLYASVKDYVQPIIKTTAISMPLLLSLHSETRTKLLVGWVYFVFGLFQAISSRQSHRIAKLFGGEEPAARKLWWGTFVLYALMSAAFLNYLNWSVIIGFIILAMLLNFWRPIMVSLIGKNSEMKYAATVLSVDSQAKSIFTMLLAPFVGVLVDYVNADSSPESAINFAPVAITGLVITGLFLLFTLRLNPKKKATENTPEDAIS